MRPHVANPDQTLLFDMHPEGQEPPIARRAITPGCLLPAPPTEFVDVARVCKILNVSIQVVLGLIDCGMLNATQAMRGTRWNITYASVVEFCDHLRIKFAIRDRRPKIAAGRRWRDADLLPFPITDTVAVKDVARGLDVSPAAVHRLVESGAFEAYRILDGSPFRISKTSLFAYAERKRNELERAKRR